MNFQTAVNLVLGHEGGESNDKVDRGGHTKFGISKNAYPDLNIGELTREDAIDIYKRDYWDRCKCDELPLKVRYIVFDGGINQGVGFICKALQRAVGVAPDGIIGPITLQKINKVDADDLLRQLAAARKNRYFKIIEDDPEQIRFKNGWLTRLDEVVKRSQA